jgi:hypothetical protein
LHSARRWGIVHSVRPPVIRVTRDGSAVIWREGDGIYCGFDVVGGLCRWSTIRCFPGVPRICMPLAWQAMLRKGTWAALPVKQPMRIWATQAGYCRKAGGRPPKYMTGNAA